MGVLHAGVQWNTQKLNGVPHTIVYLVHHRIGHRPSLKTWPPLTKGDIQYLRENSITYLTLDQILVTPLVISMESYFMNNPTE